MSFKTRKDKNSVLIGAIALSVLGFFSVRHYLEFKWEYEGYFIMFFYFAPAILAVGGLFMYFTGTVDEEDEYYIYKKKSDEKLLKASNLSYEKRQKENLNKKK